MYITKAKIFHIKLKLRYTKKRSAQRTIRNKKENLKGHRTKVSILGTVYRITTLIQNNSGLHRSKFHD